MARHVNLGEFEKRDFRFKMDDKVDKVTKLTATTNP